MCLFAKIIIYQYSLFGSILSKLRQFLKNACFNDDCEYLNNWGRTIEALLNNYFERFVTGIRNLANYFIKM